MTIKRVIQDHDKGCLVACIAMVMGWSYGDVLTHFHKDFDKYGMLTDTARDFICEHGYSVIERRGTNYMDVVEHNKRMLKPFAPIHIITYQQFADTPKINHSVVMDDKGKIYDPSPIATEVFKYYAIVLIQGFFDDRIIK